MRRSVSLLSLLLPLAVLLLAGTARADFPSSITELAGRIDDINVHAGTGWFPRNRAYASSFYDIGLELSVYLGQVHPGWDGEIAFGYDQSSGIGMHDALRGSMRTLPAITFYFDHDSGFFAGISTGIAQLSDMRYFGPPPPASAPGVVATYGIAGRTLDVGASVGWAFSSGITTEIAYRWRYFPSVGATDATGSLQPDSIPHTLDASALMFELGYQFSIKPARHAVPPPPPPVPAAASPALAPAPSPASPAASQPG